MRTRPLPCVLPAKRSGVLVLTVTQGTTGSGGRPAPIVSAGAEIGRDSALRTMSCPRGAARSEQQGWLVSVGETFGV